MKTRLWKIIPAIALTLLVSASFARRDDQATPRVIEIKAKRFTFEPNDLTLKKGEPVVLRLSTEDVIHGFYLKPLKIDATIEPSKVTEVKVTPDQVGKFVAICDHFCGAGHGNMHMVINVVE